MPPNPQRSRPRKPAASQPRSGQPRSGQPRSARPRTDPARRAAYDVLRAVDDRDAYANLLLPAMLSERGLTGRDAAFATELTYGTLRGRGTYDAILAACSDRDDLDPPVRDVLRLGAHQLLATRVGRHAAVSTSVDLVKDVCGPRPSGFVNAVLRRVATRDLDDWIRIAAPDQSRDPSGYLAVRHSHPRWIVDAFRDALGPAAPAELEDALAAGNVRPAVVLALSPADASAAALPDSALPDSALPDGERTRWSPYGFRLAGGDPAALVAAGAAVQDEASQLAALALTRIGLAPATSGDPGPGPGPGQAAGADRLWLDLCAGPGGKARLLAGLAATRGARLIASDLHLHRARHVRDALNRAGGSGRAGVIAADGRRLPWAPGTFDRVLADVPCSGLGSLRRRPEARWRKTPADVTELSVLQRQLLNAAIDSARPGGVVAYVTCSPHLAETRDVVTDVVRARDDVTILDAPALLPEVPALRGLDPRFAQFWPHRHGTDAIFLSLLRRC
ncbi:MAG TPA: transcription antitermination factor NusB [Streptosporangiaceae bacterium]|nr:transcription antitermination factor NusB [Streptosporangiaceae bacterium]